jgi:acyl-CoA thioesterase YciA
VAHGPSLAVGQILAALVVEGEAATLLLNTHGKASMSTLVQLPNRQPVLRVIPMPADLNPAGDIFGGWVMAQIDLAGGVPAVRRARGRIATVAVNALQFREPIAVGDVVSFYADIVSVGTTSITVQVDVYAERNPKNPKVVKVTEATLTYVAVDEEGRKRQLPAA